jgi:integrase
VGDVDMKSITTFKAADYVNRHIVQNKGASKTKREKVSLISSFFKWSAKSGYVQDNVFSGLTSLIPESTSGDSSDSDRRPYTYGEMAKMISHLRKHDDRNYLPFFLIAIYSGMRSNEIASIETKEVFFRQRYIFVPKGKTESSVRDVPIHPTIEPLIKYLYKNTSDGYLLPNLKRGGYDKKRNHYIVKSFSKIKRELKLPIVYHCTRNTFCSLLENAHVQESTAMQIVGHKKKSLTFSLYSGGIKPHVLCDVVDPLRYSQRFENYIVTVIAKYIEV